MAARMSLLVIALVVVLALGPSAVSSSRLLARHGGDRSSLDNTGPGRRYGGGKHGQQVPYKDSNTDGDDAGDNNNSSGGGEDDDNTPQRRWGNSNKLPAKRPQNQNDDGDNSADGEETPQQQQPSRSSNLAQGATDDSQQTPQSATPPGKKSGRRQSGGAPSEDAPSGTSDGAAPSQGSTPTDSTPTSGSTPANTTSGSSGTLSDPELQKALDLHNSLRAKHGANPLVWNTQLATQAQNWAKGCSHSHSIKDNNWIYGESIQWGVPNFEAAINSWYSEVSKYHGQANCYNDATAHFSQIVWKATKNLGCGYAPCSDKMKFYVCQYTPGNGEQGSCQQNVQAA